MAGFMAKPDVDSMYPSLSRVKPDATKYARQGANAGQGAGGDTAPTTSAEGISVADTRDAPSVDLGPLGEVGVTDAVGVAMGPTGVIGSVATGFNEVMGMLGINHGVVGKNATRPAVNSPGFAATTAAGNTATSRGKAGNTHSAAQARSGNVSTRGAAEQAPAASSGRSGGVASGPPSDGAGNPGPGGDGTGGGNPGGDNPGPGGDGTGGGNPGGDNPGPGGDGTGGPDFLKGGLVSDKDANTMLTEQKFANISEGEFVFSRAAVKYYGVKKLEDMNNKAIEHFGSPDPEPQVSPEKLQKTNQKVVDNKSKPNTPKSQGNKKKDRK